MEIIKVTTKEQLKTLYDAWALTWEGLNSSDFEEALYCCSKKGRDGTMYLIDGQTMNDICKLTGDNAYPADLNIAMIKDFKCLAMQYGARWCTDIVDNNARRQSYHPFAIQY